MDTITRSEFERLEALVEGLQPSSPAYVPDHSRDIKYLSERLAAQEVELRRLKDLAAARTEAVVAEVRRQVLADINRRIEKNGVALSGALGEVIRDTKVELDSRLKATAVAAANDAAQARAVAAQHTENSIETLKAHAYRWAHGE